MGFAFYDIPHICIPIFNSVHITLITKSSVAWNDYKLLKGCWLQIYLWS